MLSFTPQRMTFALIIIISAAVVAGQVIGWPQRAIIMAVASFAVLFLLSSGQIGSHLVQLDHELPDTEPTAIEQHDDFTALIELLPDPFLLIESGRVTQANRAAFQLLGDHVGGQNVRTAFRHPAAIERLTREYAEQVEPLDLVGLGQEGQHWRMRTTRLSSGSLLVHLQDKSMVSAAEKMRVDFVANASHELMTPLAGIKGFIETLADDSAGSDAETRHHFLGIMARESERMQALIRDLISLSRIASEKYEIPETKTALDELAQEVVRTLKSAGDARADDIQLTLEPLRPLHADPVLMKQLMHNLVGNAMKYGRKGSPILVHVGPTRSGTMARFVVEDEGEGISQEHIPRLTERFYRVDSGRSKKLGGTGLGLSLVKHIVERHRGNLSITSNVGKGTRISVLLPIN